MSLSLLGSLWKTGLPNPVYILRATHISPYRPLARDRILKSLLTSPRHGPLTAERLESLDSDPANDPWACIIGRPGEGHLPVTEFGMPHLSGPLWANDGEHDALGKWDVVCRVATIAKLKKNTSVLDRLIQWGEHSSEILSAVACAAVSSAFTADPVIHPSHVSKLVEDALEASTDGSSSNVPVSIPLPTGRVLDTIDLPGRHPADVSIIQPLHGSVIILVDQSTVGIGLAMDEYPQLAPTLLDIRGRVLSLFPVLRNATSVPAICLVGPMEADGCDTIDGHYICSCQAYLTWEEALPKPILLALAVAQGLKGSVAYAKWLEAKDSSVPCPQYPLLLHCRSPNKPVRCPELLDGKPHTYHERDSGLQASKIARVARTDKSQNGTYANPTGEFPMPSAGFVLEIRRRTVNNTRNVVDLHQKTAEIHQKTPDTQQQSSSSCHWMYPRQPVEDAYGR
ncbi:hypothetical protein DFH07DRAFT_1060824 [Mycena maculata]|uniref:Uncharacterized protein n=1 Tax=Mycena maculata TaxID=230809 RepID=A0AAD7NEI1_9AGAR|nr:hypothetical protein DFH07DRAFT_1060824 [Mycena maculata]